MDRKSKILSMALRENDNDRQCIDFLAVPNHEGKGTDKNERHLAIQGTYFTYVEARYNFKKILNFFRTT